MEVVGNYKKKIALEKREVLVHFKTGIIKLRMFYSMSQNSNSN